MVFFFVLFSVGFLTHFTAFDPPIFGFVCLSFSYTTVNSPNEYSVFKPASTDWATWESQHFCRWFAQYSSLAIRVHDELLSVWVPMWPIFMMNSSWAQCHCHVSPEEGTEAEPYNMSEVGQNPVPICFVTSFKFKNHFLLVKLWPTVLLIMFICTQLKNGLDHTGCLDPTLHMKCHEILFYSESNLCKLILTMTVIKYKIFVFSCLLLLLLEDG